MKTTWEITPQKLADSLRRAQDMGEKAEGSLKTMFIKLQKDRGPANIRTAAGQELSLEQQWSAPMRAAETRPSSI